MNKKLSIVVDVYSMMGVGTPVKCLNDALAPIRNLRVNTKEFRSLIAEGLIIRVPEGFLVTPLNSEDYIEKTFG